MVDGDDGGDDEDVDADAACDCSFRLKHPANSRINCETPNPTMAATGKPTLARAVLENGKPCVVFVLEFQVCFPVKCSMSRCGKGAVRSAIATTATRTFNNQNRNSNPDTSTYKSKRSARARTRATAEAAAAAVTTVSTTTTTLNNMNKPQKHFRGQ